MSVVIHRRNPFVASREADERSKTALANNPVKRQYFAKREVVKSNGAFPFGEGHLYEAEPARRDASWMSGVGRPGTTAVAGHRGSKPQQQDAFAAETFTVGGKHAAVVVAADGVSASGPLASAASKRATSVFLERLRAGLKQAPTTEAARHTHVERAMKQAAFAANFEVVRQVLLDFSHDGRFDAKDRARIRNLSGIDLPTRKLADAEMRSLSGALDQAVKVMDPTGKSALTTFAVAVAVDNDLYTYSCGDAVVSLYRPSEPKGQRIVHLTHRDQQVVELFLRGDDAFQNAPDVYENIITKCFGEGGKVAGTLRRYPNLLEPNDRVISSTDGLGPRGPGRGLSRAKMEAVLDAHPGPTAARALVRAQVKDIEPGEYQDNIGIAVLDIE